MFENSGFYTRETARKLKPDQYKEKFWGVIYEQGDILPLAQGTLDEMVKKYIGEPEGEQVADDSQFPIDRS